MREFNLLHSLPSSDRDVKKRKDLKDPVVVQESKKFSELYFDGPREYGYGGYEYDGRWKPVALDIVKEYDLKTGDKVLDVGCAKGFLVKDLAESCPGLDVFGIDVSAYAVSNCHEDVGSKLQVANALDLPFPDNTFDLVLAINVLHNLPRDKVVLALREIERVSKPNSNAFVQVDAYRTEAEKEVFLSWVLTAECYGYPSEWINIFHEAEYRGDYFWTILETSGKNYVG